MLSNEEFPLQDNKNEYKIGKDVTLQSRLEGEGHERWVERDGQQHMADPGVCHGPPSQEGGDAVRVRDEAGQTEDGHHTAHGQRDEDGVLEVLGDHGHFGEEV